jgi:hypothetical protein
MHLFPYISVSPIMNRTERTFYFPTFPAVLQPPSDIPATEVEWTYLHLRRAANLDQEARTCAHLHCKVSQSPEEYGDIRSGVFNFDFNGTTSLPNRILCYKRIMAGVVPRRMMKIQKHGVVVLRHAVTLTHQLLFAAPPVGTSEIIDICLIL